MAIDRVTGTLRSIAGSGGRLLERGQVEILSSLTRGDERCQFAVHLPSRGDERWGYRLRDQT